MSDDMIWDFEEQSGSGDHYVAHYTLEYGAEIHNVSIAKMSEGAYIVAAHIIGNEWLPYTQSPQGNNGRGFATIEEALARAEDAARRRRGDE